MNDIYEVAVILQKQGIHPLKDFHSNTPLVWLTSKYVAVEVDEKTVPKAYKFFKKAFNSVNSVKLSTGSYIVKAVGLTDELKKALAN